VHYSEVLHLIVLVLFSPSEWPQITDNFLVAHLNNFTSSGAWAPRSQASLQSMLEVNQLIGMANYLGPILSFHNNR
jgi:hypothetical protein